MSGSVMHLDLFWMDDASFIQHPTQAWPTGSGTGLSIVAIAVWKHQKKVG